MSNTQNDKVVISQKKGQSFVGPLINRSQSKMNLKEFFSLLWLNFTVFLSNLWEFACVTVRYYGNFAFLKADIALRLMYLFHNPYSISKRFLMKRGEKEIYAYGETPLTSLETIVQEAQIGKNDCVFELGSGRGRTCFWLNSFIGCSVVGIEYIPEFVERANRIKKRLNFQNLEFRLADFRNVEFKGATVCYLYGTCLDDSSIQSLIEKFSKLPIGTKIITVSYPLTEYTNKTCFEVMKRFMVPYTWGKADVFVHVVTK